MPIQKTKKPAKKAETNPAIAKKPVVAKNLKPLNGKNGRAVKPVMAAPVRPMPAPDGKADPKVQYKAFERGIQLFHKRNFREAREMFEQASQGPVREISSNAQSHVRMCERRLATSAPEPNSDEEHYNYA